MAEIESVRLPVRPHSRARRCYALLEAVRRARDDLQASGRGARAARSATNEPGRSEILAFVEDVGRHNAVDAIAGRMWLDRIDGADKIFYTTGRLHSRMVIKAAQMGIPFLVSRSGLTADGLRDRREGRYDDDRPRDTSTSCLHRRATVRSEH
jgi:FdhD protein